MNRKTVKRLFLSLVCLIPLAVSAETATVGGVTWTYTLNEDGTATIGPQDNGGGGSTSGRPAVSPTPTGELVIPSELAGIRVTRIGREAFNGCRGLTSVIIPEGITFIGYHAFFNCSSLASIVIPEGVTTIRDAAFYGCSKLSSVTLPKSLTSMEYYVFYQCSSLTSIEIPDGVQIIDRTTFQGCTSLVSVKLPDSVTTIGENAFAGCSSLRSFTIPTSLTSIASSAFSGCSALPVDEQGIRYESDERKGIISVPTSFTGALSIPDSVSFIFPNAFNGCTGVTSIAFPESIAFLGNPALLTCSSLPTDEYGVRYESDARRVLISAPTSLSGAFRIPDSVHKIGANAFQNCRDLTSVTIPEGVVSIGDYAFSHCTKLTSIDLPSTVIAIGGHAFEYCSSLTSWDLPEGVETIGEYAFSYNSSLRSFKLPASVTSMPFNAFTWPNTLEKLEVASGNPLYYTESNILYNKEKTEILGIVKKGISGNIVLPSSITSIPSNAFFGCSSLTSVTIPNGVTTIGNSAFNGCSSLTSVTIPNGVTTIGNSAFNGCSSLTSVTIPDSVTSIGGSAFRDCSSLTSVTIPEGVTSIEGYAFNGCSSLTAFSLPASVTTMPESALPPSSNNLKTLEVAPDSSLYCTENNILYNKDKTKILCVARGGIAGALTLPSTLTSIPASAFHGCSSLTSVTIPEGVTSIGSRAFFWCDSLKDVTFLGDVPQGFSGSELNGKHIDFPKEYGTNWTAALSNRGTYAEIVNRAGVTATAEMPTPKTMKVTYSVKSEKEKVKVRAVAFKDGVRSFANVVPVKSGTDVPNGAEVTANEEHTFVWNISEDWDIDLAKVAVEILVEEGTLLPQELITIPGAPMNRADMTITRNTISEAQAFDALLWCYAEGDTKVVIDSGRVKIDNKLVAEGASIVTWDGGKSVYWQGKYNQWVTGYVSTLLNYLYGKMGYKVLSGDDYTYAKAATRLNLAKEGLGQVSVKIAETAKE